MRFMLLIAAIALAGCIAPDETEAERYARLKSHLISCGFPAQGKIPVAEAEAYKACAWEKEREYQLAQGSAVGTDNPAVLESYYNWPPQRSVTIYCNGC